MILINLLFLVLLYLFSHGKVLLPWPLLASLTGISILLGAALFPVGLIWFTPWQMAIAYGAFMMAVAVWMGNGEGLTPLTAARGAQKQPEFPPALKILPGEVHPQNLGASPVPEDQGAAEKEPKAVDPKGEKLTTLAGLIPEVLPRMPEADLRAGTEGEKEEESFSHYINQGFKAKAQGKLQQAADFFKKARSLAPDDSACLFVGLELGMIWKETGQKEKAAAAFKELLESWPTGKEDGLRREIQAIMAGMEVSRLSGGNGNDQERGNPWFVGHQYC